jgi:ABC-type branched-subunit amino acid transport system permease subunit
MLVFSTLNNKPGVLLYAAVFCAVAIVNTVALLFFDKDTFVLCGYGLASSVYALSLRLTDFTKGDLGLQFGVDVQGLWPQYVIPILGALLIGFLGVLLTQSRLGSILTAFGDNSLLLRSVCPSYGLAVFAFNILASVAFLALGCLMALHHGRVDPQNFSPDVAFDYAVVLILGGNGTLRGCVLGPIALLLLRVLFDHLSWPDLHRLVLQSALIYLLIFRPTGLSGKVLYERR